MKKFIRLCRDFTDFDGFRLIPGSIYGRNNSARFVCQNFSGIHDGTLCIFEQVSSAFERSPSLWKCRKITRDDWRYQAITDFIRQLGYIPKPCKIRNIPGSPCLRRVVYDYTPTGTSVGSLIRQSHDNADYGGQPVNNPEPYWAGYVKGERRYVKNPLTEK